MSDEPAAPLRVFVYGTLRRGGRFHDRFCGGALAIESACVRGKLSRLAAGYPGLDVPSGDVLARGSADPLADARRLDGIEPKESEPDAEWPEVRGELMTFDDPAQRLRSLDDLEGFDPAGQSLYRRVALTVRRCGGTRTTAWVYVRGE